MRSWFHYHLSRGMKASSKESINSRPQGEEERSVVRFINLVLGSITCVDGAQTEPEDWHNKSLVRRNGKTCEGLQDEG